MISVFQVRAEKSNKLELRFRPEDPYSHPAFGELQPCTKFLLKISKKNVKNIKNVMDCNRISEHVSADSPRLNEDISISQSTETIENIFQPNSESVRASSEAKPHNRHQEQLSADIVARVSEAYHFNGEPFLYHRPVLHFNYKLCLFDHFIIDCVLFSEGMVDYQHVLAVHADATRRKKRNFADIEPESG